MLSQHSNGTGLSMDTSDLPIRFFPGRKESVVMDKAQNVDVKGNLINKLNLVNTFANGGVSNIINENKSSTGFSRLTLEHPDVTSYIQTGTNERLKLTTESATLANRTISLNPGNVEAVRVESTGFTKFSNNVEVGHMITTKNAWIEVSLGQAFDLFFEN